MHSLDRKSSTLQLFILCSLLLISFLSLPSIIHADEPSTRARPWLFISGEKIPGLRSLDEVREGLKEGHSRKLWNALLEKVNQDLKEPPVTMEERNRSYFFVAKTSFRIIDCSLVGLITGEKKYSDAAYEQIEVLFDEKKWPDWRDKAHIQVGLNADLRHGQLVRAIALAYDWLYDTFSDEQKQFIIEGLNRRAIPQFKAGLEAKEHWSGRHSNWMTCVLGGYGILAMALGPDHPDSEWILDVVRPRLEKYMGIIGPEGEFNESVQYSGSTMYVVDYFTALFYSSAGKENSLKEFGLDKFCRWYMYATVPPGRVFGFGDPGPAMPPAVGHLGAIASVTQDQYIQWFYLQYADLMLDGHHQRALEFLYYDPSVEPVSPEGKLPLGKAYHHQARLISSRSSWNPEITTSVVYAKAGKEDYHCHADWGQVCIDGYGKRLIIDHGSPKEGYPRSDKEQYYNYQQVGHNVPVIGDSTTGGNILWKDRRQGKITWSEFDDQKGGAWTMDLSDVYGEGRQVKRYVVHLLPRVAVVLDEINLEKEELISLRWHPMNESIPDPEGCFVVEEEGVTLSGCVVSLEDDYEVSTGVHLYKPPYDKNRYGSPYTQLKPPYIKIQSKGKSARYLSLFAIYDSTENVPRWQKTDTGWKISTEEGEVFVYPDQVSVRCGEKDWKIPVGD